MPGPKRYASNQSPLPDGRNALGRERIVAESLKLLEESGLSGLSTRRLAERLRVKSPALYWHVHSKDELLQLIADAICAQIHVPERKRSYREQLEAIAHEYRRVLLKYRDATRLFAEQPPTGPHRIRLYDAAVGAFLDAGFSKAEAVAMTTFYRHYLLGMIAEELRMRHIEGGNALSPAFALGSALQHLEKTGHDFQNLKGTSELLRDLQPEKLFEIGLTVLLNGIECRRKEIKRPGPSLSSNDAVR
ncbi:MAG: TetR/AcrR family transcriptional regulator C-terminal domain-containing protein [Acidobacteriaceae bacterium]